MHVVRWKRSAENKLAQLWIDSPDKLSITSAVAEIDRILASNPHQAGESRSGHVRVLFVPPLGVFFEVDEPSRTVQVLRVWSF